MHTFSHDLRIAARALAKQPGFVAVAVLSLGLAIGVATTIFSLVNAIRFRPMPHIDADRLVLLFEHHPVEVCQGCRFGASYPAFLDWRARASSFEDLAAASSADLLLTGDGHDARRIHGAYVSSNLFSLLRVQPMLGRTFRAEEDRPGGDPVAIVSHTLWQERYAGDPALVGRTVAVNGRPHTVVGIMPRGFLYPTSEHVWLPLAPLAIDKPRDDYLLGVAGRLKREVPIETARADMESIAAGLAQAYPSTNAGWTVHVRPFREVMIEEYAVASTALGGLVASVLLVACANLANLQLARGTLRAREMAVRAALGASRTRLLRLVLTESMLAAILGGTCGLLLATWGIRLLRFLPTDALPFWMEFAIDVRVLAFAIVVTALACLVFGLTPALHASRVDLNTSLRGGSQATLRPARLRTILVVSEIAVSLTIVTGAAMMGQALMRMGRMDRLGYDPHQVVQGNLQTLAARYEGEGALTSLHDRLLDRLRGAPHVRAAALRAMRVDFSGQPTISFDDRAEPVTDRAPNVVYAITPDYFRVLSIPVLHGRAFTEADRAGSAPVAIITNAMARRFWIAGHPLGRRFRMGTPSPASPWLTVVGVIGDTISSPYSGRFGEQPFVPLAQHPMSDVTVLASTDADVASALASVRDAVRFVDPDLPIEDLMPLEQALRAWVSPVRLLTWFAGSMAIFAVALAALGIYGVVAFAVNARRREIGVRLAIGARPADVVRLFLRQGLVMSAGGLVFGAVGGFIAARVITTSVLRVESLNALFVLSIAALLAGVVLLACYWPARTAATIDPMEVLRPE